MGIVLFFGVGVGFAGALAATFFLSRRILAAILPRGPNAAAQRRTIVKGALAGAGIALVPGLLLGTVIGATLGGTYGGALAEGSGARDSGVLAGVALGVFTVATLLLTLSVGLGAWIGRQVAKASATPE